MGKRIPETYTLFALGNDYFPNSVIYDKSFFSLFESKPNFIFGIISFLYF